MRSLACSLDSILSNHKLNVAPFVRLALLHRARLELSSCILLLKASRIDLLRFHVLPSPHPLSATVTVPKVSRLRPLETFQQAGRLRPWEAKRTFSVA